jgi:hypothetical protein
MTAAIYQTGDTIQITDGFYSFAGVLTDLSAAPAVKLYAADKTTVAVTTTSTKISTGTYRASVTLPVTEGIYYLSFEGTAADATAIYHREAIVVKFASST